MPDPSSMPAWCTVDAELAIAKVQAQPGAEIAGRLAAAIGTAVPAPNRQAVGSGLSLAALAPGEWLLTGAADAVAMALERADGALPAEPLLALDVTDGCVTFVLEGPDALTCLAAYTPLDLRPHRFPVGSVLRTRFGDIQVCVMRLSETPTVRLIADQSYAAYLTHLMARCTIAAAPQSQWSPQ